MHNLGYAEETTTRSAQLLRSKTSTGDKQKYFASQGRTMEEAIGHFATLSHKLDSLQRLGLVKSYTHTSQLFVPLQEQQQRIDAWQHYWTPERLRTVRRLISETAPQAGLQADAFQPFFDAATAHYEPDALYEGDVLPRGFQSTLMERLRVGEQSSGMRSYGGDCLCFTSVSCQNDSVRSSDSDYMRICDAIASDPHLLVLDTYYYTTGTLLQMSRDFDVLQWLSMAFVFVVLLVSFRFNLKLTLLGFMPILLSWLIVLGSMVLFGVSFNLISIIVSTFIFGIGVDYSIFIMQGLVSDGLSDADASFSALASHKTAILLSATILVITVSSMLLARHPAIRSVGFSTLVGLLSAVVLSYVLQPAIYRWLNRTPKTSNLKSQTSMKHDVIVIGSGLGGLICARQLARSGRSVLVLERQRQPGGCLQSYRRGGTDFDTGLHYVGGLAEGQPLHEAFAQLGLLSLKWQRLDADGFDRVTIGSQTFPLAEGFDCFARVLGGRFPQERGALEQFTQLLRHLPPMEECCQVSAYDYLSSLFRDPLLIQVLSAPAMRMELRRESLPLFSLAHGLSSYVQSSWRLKGSGNLMVQSLLGDICKAGGEVCCGAEVEELQAQGGRIVAARCADGRRFEGRLFVSDVHPQLTLGWLRQPGLLKNMFRRRIMMLQNTPGMLTVSLVLKPGMLPYFNHNKYVFREANIWSTSPPGLGPDAAIDRVMVSCRVPDDSAQQGLQIDLLTPTAWELWQPWEQTTVGHRGQDYEQQKQRLASQCISLAERVIPGLRSMVERLYVSTPLTWRDYTLSPCGSAFGIRKDCRSPLLTMLSPRTPVPNLFLTGQSLVLHGLEGVTMTAMRTIKEIGDD